MGRKIIDHKGHRYEMGHSYAERRRGDLAQLKDGRLEIISGITVMQDYSGARITLNCGESYYTFLSRKGSSILDFGKRIN
jgi:hypothetical protein